jgi:hypothetical protein
VAEKGYAGPLFNDFNWGGYLIWALPGLPVAIDGRTNLHGDERIERYGNTWAGLPGWQNDPDLSAAGVVISAAEMPLGDLLKGDGRFALVLVSRREESGTLDPVVRSSAIVADLWLAGVQAGATTPWILALHTHRLGGTGEPVALVFVSRR